MSSHPACMCKWFGADPNSQHGIMPQYEVVPQSYAAVQLERSRPTAHTRTIPPAPPRSVARLPHHPNRVVQERHVPQLPQGARLGRARAAAPPQGQGAAHAGARILRC